MQCLIFKKQDFKYFYINIVHTFYVVLYLTTSNVKYVFHIPFEMTQKSNTYSFIIITLGIT